MDDKQRLATFFAELVATPSLSAARREHFELMLRDLAKEIPRLRRYKYRKAPLPRTLLARVHRTARKWIYDLLEAGSTRPSPRDLPRPLWALHSVDGAPRVVQFHGLETPELELGMHLLRLIHDRRFPFAKCPRCGKVFARVRRQKYCSRSCTTQALESARRGKRNEYMSRYMERRRKDLKARDSVAWKRGQLRQGTSR
jgi:hypothetical protein